MKVYYERHLPHQVPEGYPIFLTWNLKGALPKEILAQIRLKKEEVEREPARLTESANDRKIRQAKLVFAFTDRFLDSTADGPLDLKVSDNAEIVEKAILFGVPEQYDLLAWCIMANHVHVLIRPRWELAKIMQRLKGSTAFQINKRQGQRGRTFWQDESYDHWARDEEELYRIIEYIEMNPVRAGLSARPEDWPWSSARFRTHWKAGQDIPPELVAEYQPAKADVRGS
jgi:putative transposase